MATGPHLVVRFSRERLKAHPDVARHSPCIGICKLDDATGYCLGCGRAGTEIGDWMAMSESQRDAVWEKLPGRLAALAVRVRLLPWIRDELVDWIRDGIVTGQGTWIIGLPGASAEFSTAGDAPIDLTVEAGVVTATHSDGAFRIAITEKVRAFAFANGGPVVLGLPKGRVSMPSATSLRALGPDSNAIDELHRNDPLFDLGAGRRYTRFCIRTGDEKLRSSLAACEGRAWPDFMSTLGAQLVASSPHRVVESTGARIEVYAKLTGDAVAQNARTDFRPGILAPGDEISASVTPPDYVAPVAIFYPNKF